MKIQKLRFKNINSLYGEWEIDFTAPEYISDGLFAITGPTGSGKSTILDALCLALYGQTPRLKVISASTNELMSRQTGECFAEVTFRTAAGTFVSHWGQHRARKKIDGNLIDAKHELSRAETGEVIESMKSRMPKVIEEKTGMDYERFTRSMLLAQGGFAAFLKAAPGERAPILEQITGTQLYTDISKEVHERKRSEYEVLEGLHRESQGIVFLTGEEESDLKDEIQQLSNRKKVADEKKQALEKQLQGLERIAVLRGELEQLEKEKKLSDEAVRNFEADRKRLDRALKAAELEGEYLRLSDKQETQKEQLEELRRCKVEIPNLENAFTLKKDRFEWAEKNLKDQKQQLRGMIGTFRAVRSLDLSLDQRGKGALELKKRRSELEKQLKKRKNRETEILTALAEKEKEEIACRTYLQDHREDQSLVSELSGINQLIEGIEAKRSETAAIRAELDEVRGKIQDADASVHEKMARCETLKAELAEKQRKEAELQDSIAKLLDGRSLREMETELEHLRRERELRRTIASLEEHRKYLEDGKPCPLCGAEKHPYAEGNIPALDEAEKQYRLLYGRIEEVKRLQDQAGIQKDSIASSREKLGAAEQDYKFSAHQLELLQQEEAKRKKLLQDAENQIQKREQSVMKQLSPYLTDASYQLTSDDQFRKQISRETEYGQGELDFPQDISLLKKELAERRDAWKKMESRRQELENAVGTLQLEQKHVIESKEDIGNDLQKIDEQLKSLETEIAAEKRKRKELFGNKDPDTEEASLNERLEQAEQKLQAAREEKDAALQKLEKTRYRLKNLREETEERGESITKLEADFVYSIHSRGFKNIEDFQKSLLSADKRKELQNRGQSLDEQQLRITDRLEEKKTALAAEEKKNLSDASMDEVRGKFEESKYQAETLFKDIVAREERLRTQEKEKKRFQEISTRIDAQKRECDRWNRLHELIGSSDGKKYRNFVQGLTFEMLISQANQQLRKLTDRYLLMKNAHEALELDVIDDYQAGEIRSTKNLSGGESFLVSLALALGLSRMSSRKVPVDSLFLDEGFGTLDEETLETALETLSHLQKYGKIIGMISHVPALKERIAARISVTPSSGGKSILSGPGCRRLI